MRLSRLKSRSSRSAGTVISCILACGLMLMLAALATAHAQPAASVHLAGVTSIPYQDPIDRPRPPASGTDEDWSFGTALAYLLAYLVLNALLSAVIFREGYKRGVKSVKPGVKWDDVKAAIDKSFDARVTEAEPYLPQDVFAETQKVIRRARDTVSADIQKVFEKK
jgi:hypothetical protein